MQIAIHRGSEAKETLFREGCWVLELHNTAADPEVSVARVRVKPGTTTVLHRLRTLTERYVVLEGRGVMGGRAHDPQDIGPGDAVIIPPGMPQQVTNPGQEDLIFLAVCTPRFVESEYEDLVED